MQMSTRRGRGEGEGLAYKEHPDGNAEDREGGRAAFRRLHLGLVERVVAGWGKHCSGLRWWDGIGCPGRI